MATQNKALAEDNINSMEPNGITNLWYGILEGLKLFNGEIGTGRVPAVFILTDGRPNYLCLP
jgi:Mg-chelatase subunit ChlD